MYRWVNPSLFTQLPLYWPYRLGSSLPHIHKALKWSCGIYKNVTLTNVNTIFLSGAPQFHIFYWFKIIKRISSNSSIL